MLTLNSSRFFGAERFTSKSEFGSVPNTFILDEVACKGTENSLFECQFITKDDCGSHEGAGVVCIGKNDNSGRISCAI